jgi:sigma-E factor negative regulatory protein RseC
MIEQQGSVVDLDGGQALIRVGPESGCPACAAGKGCGAGIFGRLLKRRPVVLRLENAIGARRGDIVRVGIPERLFLGLVTRLYLLPLLAALAGAAIGHHLGEMVSVQGWVLDAAALAGALTGILLALPRAGTGTEWLEQDMVRLLGPVRAAEGAGCMGRGRAVDQQRKEVIQ